MTDKKQPKCEYCWNPIDQHNKKRRCSKCKQNICDNCQGPDYAGVFCQKCSQQPQIGAVEVAFSRGFWAGVGDTESGKTQEEFHKAWRRYQVEVEAPND